MRGLAIDPGASTGYAVYEYEVECHGTLTTWQLLDCGAFKPGTRTWTHIDAVIAEKPQRYPHEPISPADLEALREHLRVVLRPLLAAKVPVHYVRPAEWKGQTPKPIHARRIQAKLSPPELEVYLRCMLPLGTKARTDCTDAVGLGQYAILHGIWR